MLLNTIHSTKVPNKVVLVVPPFVWFQAVYSIKCCLGGAKHFSGLINGAEDSKARDCCQEGRRPGRIQPGVNFPSKTGREPWVADARSTKWSAGSATSELRSGIFEVRTGCFQRNGAGPQCGWSRRLQQCQLFPRFPSRHKLPACSRINSAEGAKPQYFSAPELSIPQSYTDERSSSIVVFYPVSELLVLFSHPDQMSQPLLILSGSVPGHVYVSNPNSLVRS